MDKTKTRVLVTGGLGKLGSKIVDKLIEKEYEVVIIDNLSTGDRARLNTKAYFIKGDIRDVNIIRCFLRNSTIVIHMAEDKTEDSLSVNTYGGINLIQEIINHKISKMVYLNPKSSESKFYKLTKNVVEDFLEYYKSEKLLETYIIKKELTEDELDNIMKFIKVKK